MKFQQWSRWRRRIAGAASRRFMGGEFAIGDLREGSLSELETLTQGRKGTWTASGRSALGVTLKRLMESGVRHVHLPAYLCDTVVQSVRALGLDHSYYRVDGSLAAHPDPPPNSAVALIHYQGWLNPSTASLRAQCGEAFHLIEDFSQAMLSDWEGGAGSPGAIFFSARKFGMPLPCGWCDVSVDGGQPSEAIGDATSKALCAALLRSAYMADSSGPILPELEQFHHETSFRSIETILGDHPLDIGVPELTLRLLAAWDSRRAAKKRRSNWQHLHSLFEGRVDLVTPNLEEGTVPLGYLVRLPNRERVEQKLAENRIAGNWHWPLGSEVDANAFPEAAALSSSCLTLPIDQRWNEDDLARMAEVVLAAL